MEPFFEDYLERMSGLHGDLVSTIGDLSVEALDWSPEPGVNSLSVLVAHTAGAERYWIGDVAGQDSSGRIRSQEFETSGYTVSELRNLLEESLAHSREVLSAFTLNDLASARNIPRSGETCTVGWAILHALEHTAVHLGHAQISRQFWNQAHLDY